MSYKELSAAELFETRRRIIFLGIDDLGSPAGEQQSIEILNIMQARVIITPESIREYDHGLRLIESATDYDEMNESCLHFRRAINISPQFMNAHANLTGALVDMGDYFESIEAGNAGRQHGFFFDLEYNRFKAMFLSNKNPSEYFNEALTLIEAVDECVRHAEAIQRKDPLWRETRRFTKGIINQCRGIGYILGMNETQRDELDTKSYSINNARRAINIIKTFFEHLQ